MSDFATKAIAAEAPDPAAIGAILQPSDLVKFARVEPEAAAHAAMLDAATQLVTELATPKQPRR